MASSTRRRVALLAVTIGVAAVCVRLGFWQLDRLDQRREQNWLVSARLAEPPSPVSELTDLPASDAEFRPAVAEGRYDPDNERILYGRPLDGRPGDHVLTPLILEDGSAMVVDRGWVPFESGRDLPLTGEAAAPSGLVRIEGFLTDIPEAENVPEIPYEVAPLGIQLQRQDPPQAAGLPVPAPVPELDEGPHLSYAIQWFSFAGVALVGYVALEMRERRKS